MEHTSQHLEAIGPTVRVANEVSATIFDDKVREMGSVRVCKGKITISLIALPSQMSTDGVRDFLVDSIGLGIKACFDANADAFDPY